MSTSFPPFAGHTTLVTLSGFAYGMQGFFISAAASLLGSALVFVVLRRLFSKRLNAWSSQNKGWQALESVVVSYIVSIDLNLSSNSETILIEGERLAINDPDSYFTLSTVGLFQCSICGKSSILSFFLL